MIQKLLPDEVAKSLGLTLTNIQSGTSFIRGLVFYSTAYDGVYITNYDINIGDDTEYDPDLSKRGIWLIFGKVNGWTKYMKVSNEVLGETEIFLQELDELYNDLLKASQA